MLSWGGGKRWETAGGAPCPQPQRRLLFLRTTAVDETLSRPPTHCAIIPRLTMGRLFGSTSFAALGTILCCVRGDSLDLFLFDAAKHDELCRKDPSRLEHRVWPPVTAIDNKLFVFSGCLATSHSASLANVYDTSTD